MCRSQVSTIALIWCAMLSAASGAARAHFIWLGVETGQPRERACLWFAESARPGETGLIGKVAHVKAWLRRPTGERSELALQERIEETSASRMAEIPVAGSFALEAICDYGVLTRGDATFLLQYYAKHISLGAASDLNSLARADSLALDIVPQSASAGLVLQVLFEGQPVAGAEFVLAPTEGESRELKADDDGRVQIDAATARRLAVRASHFESDRAGSRDGKPYSQVRHYATLTLRLPDDSRQSTAENTRELSAESLLARARQARAVWENFPGFAGEVAIRIDDETIRGHLEVDEGGNVALDVADSPLKEWAETQLNSLVQHRMPSSDSDEHVAFATGEGDHPLGRKINLGDKELESVYRIKDDVITEVNRHMGNMRFTISVFDVEWNADGKYLPRLVTLTTWDTQSGDVRSSQTVSNTWTRLGRFDLPTRIFEVHTAKNTRQVKELLFTKHRLLKADGVASGDKTTTISRQ